MKWIAAATAVIGLITGLSGVVGPLKGWWTQDRHSKMMLAAGQKQAEIGEYAAAFDTYSDLLKSDPDYVPAIHARLDAAMLWIEDFRVSGKDDNEVTQKARDLLTRIGPVLESGLTTGKGYRETDLVAHLAWLNLAKVRLTYEDANVKENLERALKMDPNNVYANAMMGDWLLLYNFGLADAKKHFAVALQGGTARAFVRQCQLESMMEKRDGNLEVRAELIRVVNEMRKDSEPISDNVRGRIHSMYMPGVGSEAELRAVLSAVPPEDAWATYRWIDRPLSEWAPFDNFQQQFIRAILDEISGKRDEALVLFRQLQHDPQNVPGTRFDRVDAAVKRLTR